MYIHFFRLTRDPFSISPDPRYLFMSQQHHEALAHLVYGANSGGGVVLLSGEIGTGKTTVCRCFLQQVPANCNVAYIFNPKLSVSELLQAICEEFHVPLPGADKKAVGVKDYVDALNHYLLAAHAQGRNNVLIIDEAQNLSTEVLEQLRLLTNLETNERKLLQIMLIGQPELRGILARPELEQLAQRVIARCHLAALSEQETASYIQHRLSTSGLTSASPFQPAVIRQIHRLTQGVPRRINLLCDRALLGAYAHGKHEVDRAIVNKAAQELFGDMVSGAKKNASRARYAALALAAGAMVIGTTAWTMSNGAWIKTVREGLFAPRRPARHEIAKTIRPAPSDTSVSPSEPAAETSKPAAMAAAGAAPAPAAPPEPATILSEQDGSSRAGIRSENEALRQLARLWGVAAPARDADPCDALQNAQLRCHKSNNGLAELRQLDRPAILKLRDQANRTYYVLLTGLSDDNATLRAGDAMQKISMAALTRYFRGEFMLLWRAPAEFVNSVKADDSGPQVGWIANQLEKVYGGKQASGHMFDQTMEKQIREFQATQGLFVDGIVGPVTLMHLNRVAGLQEPRLSAAPAPRATAKAER